MPKASTRPSSRQDERVMVFIDGSNLYHVLGQICGRHDLQFDKFAQKLANGRDLRRVYYYNVRQEAFEDRSNASDQEKFLNSLYDTPYLEVKLGIWKQRGGTMVEKGVDVMLATDLVTRAYRDHYDTAIVVSGDADFYPALQAVKDAGKQVEVAAFDANISAEASRTTDLHINLTKTFFTGLWMTRAQQRERSVAGRKVEVTDEAASPNGEDKAATKAASASRSRQPARRPSRAAAAPRGTREQRKDEAPVRIEEPAFVPAPAAPAVEQQPEPDRSHIRRTPSRRRVGGTATVQPSNGGNGSVSRPRPPALRSPSLGSGGSAPTPAVENAPEPAPAES